MARRLDEAMLEAVTAAAQREGIPVAALAAVVEVESGGRVFARVRGRHEPLIRFEGHYFDRLLGDRAAHAQARARAEGLASPKAGRVRNPRRQAARWELLDRAIAIDREAALSSTSWGVGQVMGVHWQWLGYGSADALVAEARRGAEGQIALMLAYIAKAGLIDALQGGDFERFARVYNGPAYARHGYHTRIAKAARRYGFGRDKAADAAEDAQEDDRLKFGSRGPRVVALQRALSRVGYLLRDDGLFGLVTDRVLRQFQRDHDLPSTGIVGAREEALLEGVGSTATGQERPWCAAVRRLGAAFRRPGSASRTASLSIAERFA